MSHHQAQEGRRSLNEALGCFLDVHGFLPAVQVRTIQRPAGKATMLHPRHPHWAFPQYGCPDEIQVPKILPTVKTFASKAWGEVAKNSRRHHSQCSHSCPPGDLSHHPANLSTSVPSLGPRAAIPHLAMIYDPSYLAL